MDLQTRISEIERLNVEGIASTGGPDRDLNDAREKHLEASELAENDEVHPDHYAFSMANAAYAQRQAEGLPAALRSLDEGLEYLEERAEAGATPSFAGTGRIFEEKSLLRRAAKEYREEELMHGLVEAQLAIDSYTRAEPNVDNEILDSKQILDRRARTLGILGMIYKELAEEAGFNKGPIRELLLRRSIHKTEGELNIRTEKLGQTEGQGLANTYHGLGIVQTEVGDYHGAGSSFSKAFGLTTSDRTRVTLQLRMAWLKYTIDPDNRDAITHHMDEFLDGSGVLTGNDRRLISHQAIALGSHLGGDFEAGVAALYTPDD